MKKLSLLLCAGVLVLSLTACGKDTPGDNSSGSGSQGTQQDGGSGNSRPEETPGSSSAGTEDNQQGDGSDTVIDVSNGWSEQMEAIKTAVVEAVGEDNYFPNMIVDPELFESFFGVSPSMYEDYLCEMPMISVNVDMLIVVKAKDGQAEAVEKALTAYRETQVNNTMQYPQNVDKIQASRVERVGNYVLYVQLGGDAGEADSAGAIAHHSEVNELVIEVISQQLEH